MCGFQGERDKAQLVFYLLRDNIKSYLCGWDWMDMGWDGIGISGLGEVKSTLRPNILRVKAKNSPRASKREKAEKRNRKVHISNW